jgi:hypothetical protein
MKKFLIKKEMFDSDIKYSHSNSYGSIDDLISKLNAYKSLGYNQVMFEHYIDSYDECSGSSVLEVNFREYAEETDEEYQKRLQKKTKKKKAE